MICDVFGKELSVGISFNLYCGLSIFIKPFSSGLKDKGDLGMRKIVDVIVTVNVAIIPADSGSTFDAAIIPMDEGRMYVRLQKVACICVCP